jgi:fibronectin type 3 domain-containing protein
MIKTMALTIVVLVLMVSAGCGPTGPDIPTPPTGLTVTATPQIMLNWNGVKDATSYNVYRGPVLGGVAAFALLATNVTVTTYTDTSAVSGTTYSYQVTAVNSLGESGASNQVNATAP